MRRVLHLTDTHIVATEDVARPPHTFAGAIAEAQGRSTTESLIAVLDAVVAAGIEPDLVLHTGDVADDGEPASYTVIRGLLDRMGAPVVVVPGNHDDLVALATAFGHEPVPVRSLDLDGWRVVAVDSAVQHQDHGTLSGEALAALESALAGAPGPVLVGLHHPPISVCPQPSCRLEQAAEVLEVLRRHPQVRGVVSGHLHVTEEIEREGVQFLLSPSSCVQLRHEHPLPRHNRVPTPVGARVLELADDGTLTSEVIWVGEATR